ncbi:hypothetical protein [Bacillus sp. AFS041924]|nr:hypothetical protein [Bacillus sp. AFS041924]
MLAGYLGVKYVFFVTSALLLLNVVLVYVNVNKKLNVKDEYKLSM